LNCDDVNELNDAVDNKDAVGNAVEILLPLPTHVYPFVNLP